MALAGRLRHTLIGERTQWLQRIQATLFHHGISGTPDKLRTRAGRAFLDALELPADARERIDAGPVPDADRALVDEHAESVQHGASARLGLAHQSCPRRIRG
jgi:hypothetical protein